MKLLKCFKEGEEERKRLLMSLKCCNRTLGSARIPPNCVMWSAKQHIVDSTTINLGPSDMPGQNFVGPANRETHVIIWSA